MEGDAESDPPSASTRHGGRSLAVEAALIYDAMSGASPLYFNTLSGASGVGITDYRTAGDIKFTKYFDGVAVDAFGLGGAADVIDSVNGVAKNQHHNSLEYLVGITQVLSAEAVIQSCPGD